MLAELQFLPFFYLLLSSACSDPVMTTGMDPETELNLIYVQAIWRHGDRAPHGLPYPNDQNRENAWPRGWSQLTNKGIKQMYKLGLFFRQRYDKFIGDFYPGNILVMASNLDRVIVSAQAMLRGLFPVRDSQLQWLDGEQWQPIPFHTESIERNDPLLHPTHHRCPRYDAVMKGEAQSVRDEMMREHADLVNFLANVTGIGTNMTFYRLASLIDIEREMYHQLPQPEWVFRKWPQYENKYTIDIIKEFTHVSQMTEYDTSEKVHLKGGLLLGDILDRFRNVSEGITIQPRKMHLYSAHDASLAALQYALGINNNMPVPYSACLIMELYQRNTNETVVKVLYKNETENPQAYELSIPGCSVPCRLNQLISLTAATALHNVNELGKACRESQLSESIYQTSDASSSGTRLHLILWPVHFAAVLFYSLSIIY